MRLRTEINRNFFKMYQEINQLLVLFSNSIFFYLNNLQKYEAKQLVLLVIFSASLPFVVEPTVSILKNQIKQCFQRMTSSFKRTVHNTESDALQMNITGSFNSGSKIVFFRIYYIGTLYWNVEDRGKEARSEQYSFSVQLVLLYSTTLH